METIDQDELDLMTGNHYLSACTNGRSGKRMVLKERKLEDLNWHPMGGNTEDKHYNGVCIEECILQNVDMRFMNFSGSTMKRCVFERCRFTFSDMSKSIFAGSSFDSCYFMGTNMQGSDLRYCWFSEKSFFNTNLQDCNLYGALRSDDELVEAFTRGVKNLEWRNGIVKWTMN
jgi:uncharacterized protein YjbI with pentapeptide repeats